MFQEINSEILPLSEYGEQLNLAKPNNGSCLKSKNKYFFFLFLLTTSFHLVSIIPNAHLVCASSMSSQYAFVFRLLCQSFLCLNFFFNMAQQVFT